MAINPILAVIAPALLQVLQQIQAAATAVTAEPTVETLNQQLGELEVDALNPTNLEGVSLASAAQEVVNITVALEAHLNAATAAPTAASTTLAAAAS